MVQFGLDNDAESFSCEGCGAELPAFLDHCPYCVDDSEDDEASTLPCPDCGTELHEDAQRCLNCGSWVTLKVGSSASGRRFYALVALIVALVFLLVGIGLFF